MTIAKIIFCQTCIEEKTSIPMTEEEARLHLDLHPDHVLADLDKIDDEEMNFLNV